MVSRVTVTIAPYTDKLITNAIQAGIRKSKTFKVCVLNKKKKCIYLQHMKNSKQLDFRLKKMPVCTLLMFPGQS